MSRGALLSRLPLLALVAAAACWGSVVVTVKVAAEGLSTAALTAVELTASALVLAVLLVGAAVSGRRLPRPSLGVLLAAVLEPGATYLLVNAGIARTSGTHAAVLIGAESAFVVLMSAVLTRAVPPRGVLLGLGLAVAGTVVVADSAGGDATLGGDLLVLAGVLAAAGYVLVASMLAPHMSALHLTGYQFVVGWLVTTPVLVLLLTLHGAGAAPRDPRPVAAAILTGLVGSVAAFMLYNWALTSVSTALAGTSLTLIPVFGVAMSVGFLGDQVSLRTLLAAAAVVAGLVITHRADASG